MYLLPARGSAQREAVMDKQGWLLSKYGAEKHGEDCGSTYLDFI